MFISLCPCYVGQSSTTTSRSSRGTHTNTHENNVNIKTTTRLHLKYTTTRQIRARGAHSHRHRAHIGGACVFCVCICCFHLMVMPSQVFVTYTAIGELLSNILYSVRTYETAHGAAVWQRNCWLHTAHVQ